MHELSTGRLSSDPNLKSYYKTYTNILKKVIFEAKSNSNRDYIANAKNKGKALWDVIKKETGKTSENATQTIELLNNHIVKDPQTVAELFNKYFANVTSYNTSQAINQTSITNCNINNNTIFLTPVSSLEILKIMKNLKNSLTGGFDEIPDHIIKRYAALLTVPL